MFGLGFTEILFILVIALLVLGPKKLPSAARDLGRITAQLKRALDDFKHDLHVAQVRDIGNSCPQDSAEEKEVRPTEVPYTPALPESESEALPADSTDATAENKNPSKDPAE